MATFIKTDGSVQEVHPADGKVFTYDELQGFIGGKGNLVEIVPLPNGIESIVINEEGKIIGLEENKVATQIWKKAYPIGQFPVNNDQLIVGDALIANEKELGNE